MTASNGSGIPKFTAYRKWQLERVFFGRSAVQNLWQWCLGDDGEWYIGMVDWS